MSWRWVRRPWWWLVLASLMAWGAPGQAADAPALVGLGPWFNSPPLSLAQLRGKVVLLVNTASFRGFTPQYLDLEAVYEKYKDRGLVVLGVPSNDFGEQEPGSNKEIKAFCETYDVSFPLTQKQQVVGRGAHPLYRWIAAELGEGFMPAFWPIPTGFLTESAAAAAIAGLTRCVRLPFP